MFEVFKSKIAQHKMKAAMVVAAALGNASMASATIDFSAITDLLNVTFDVLDIVVANTSTLVSVVVLFATLALVGIIVYGFIGKLLTKVTNMGGKGKE